VLWCNCLVFGKISHDLACTTDRRDETRFIRMRKLSGELWLTTGEMTKQRINNAARRLAIDHWQKSSRPRGQQRMSRQFRRPFTIAIKLANGFLLPSVGAHIGRHGKRSRGSLAPVPPRARICAIIPGTPVTSVRFRFSRACARAAIRQSSVNLSKTRRASIRRRLSRRGQRRQLMRRYSAKKISPRSQSTHKMLHDY